MATDKEIWKQITFLKGRTNKNYAVSSHGRLASYDDDMNDKYILKLHENGGFPMSTIHLDGKSKALFAHNAVAAEFLKKKNPKSSVVIHLDYDKANNHLSNLQWATKKEQIEHTKGSPHLKASIAHKIYTGANAKKLDEKKVARLKKEIWDPKRKLTLKQLANKYDIAEMNLYRIKTGQMWFHVHVEGEPVFPRYKAQLKNIELHHKALAKEEVEKAKRKVKTDGIRKKSAEKRQKKEAEKKARLTVLLANRKKKAIERIAIDKRKVARAVSAKKVKAEKEKRKAAFVKLQSERLKKRESQEKKLIENAKKLKEKKPLSSAASKSLKADKKSKIDKKDKKGKKSKKGKKK